jgi:DNA ligase-associated metallophosphoesterase
MTSPALAQIPAMAVSPCGALWIRLNGRPVQLRVSGALWLEAERTLVAADLHLEKGSAYAARGQLLPPYDTPATLSRLEAEVRALSPRRIVLLGDSFHDARGTERMPARDHARIAALAAVSELVWIVGNHDAEGLNDLPGHRADVVEVPGLVLRHEPQPGLAPGEVAGHLHPCARVVAAGRGVRRRSFATDGARLILPAFGAYAGGLNLRDAAFQGLFQGPPMAGALGADRVHPLPFTRLRPD